MMETQRYIELAREFCMFGIIGAIGFVVNIASVYIFRDAIGLYLAGSAAWFVAATVTWFLNRNWTFNRRGRTSMLRQWISFLLANSFGFIVSGGSFPPSTRRGR
jgi:putative flippase GtrA